MTLSENIKIVGLGSPWDNPAQPSLFGPVPFLCVSFLCVTTRCKICYYCTSNPKLIPCVMSSSIAHGRCGWLFLLKGGLIILGYLVGNSLSSYFLRSHLLVTFRFSGVNCNCTGGGRVLGSSSNLEGRDLFLCWLSIIYKIKKIILSFWRRDALKQRYNVFSMGYPFYLCDL